MSKYQELMKIHLKSLGNQYHHLRSVGLKTIAIVFW